MGGLRLRVDEELVVWEDEEFIRKKNKADQDAVWSWWNVQKDDLRDAMVADANAKRRRLEREKRSLDNKISRKCRSPVDDSGRSRLSFLICLQYSSPPPGYLRERTSSRVSKHQADCQAASASLLFVRVITERHSPEPSTSFRNRCGERFGDHPQCAPSEHSAAGSASPAASCSILRTSCSCGCCR